MLINAGVNMPAPGSAGVPPAGGGRRTDFDFDFDPDFDFDDVPPAYGRGGPCGRPGSPAGVKCVSGRALKERG